MALPRNYSFQPRLQKKTSTSACFWDVYIPGADEAHKRSFWGSGNVNLLFRRTQNCLNELKSMLSYITLHCIALHYITLHCITLHYITLYYITLHCITLHYIVLHYIVLHYITLYYITLHCITLHYITLHYIVLHYIVLHYITLHYITLYYITLYYITLYYITLHCIALHCIIVIEQALLSRPRLKFKSEPGTSPELREEMHSSKSLVLPVHLFVPLLTVLLHLQLRLYNACVTHL